MKTREEVLAILVAQNPKSKPQNLNLYCDTYMAYQEAEQNIRQNGNVCAHPRTGAPMTNPYGAIRSRALADFAKFKFTLNTEGLW